MPKRPSRIHSPTHILDEIGRLRRKVERAYEDRVEAGDREVVLWCLRTADALDAILVHGRKVLPINRDPRPAARVRKSPRPDTLADFYDPR